MTTDGTNRLRDIALNGLKTCLMLMAIIMGWVGSMALVMLTTEIAPASIAVVTDTSILSSLPRHISLIRNNSHTLVLTSNRPGYVRELYHSGAWLVLPSLGNGCLNLNPARKIKQPS